MGAIRNLVFSTKKGYTFTGVPLITTSLLGDPDLWVHYEFDGNALDSSGNGNHGTEVTTIDYSIDNPFEKGLLLTGSGHINLPYSSNYVGTQTINVVAKGINRIFQNGSDWVNPDYKGWNNLMGITNSNTVQGYTVVRTGLGAHGGNISVNADYDLLEEYHTYTCVVDFGTNLYTFWFDGKMIRSLVIDPNDLYDTLRGSGRDSTVGTRYGTGGASWGPFSGQILDFAYFKRALTESEIKELAGK